MGTVNPQTKYDRFGVSRLAETTKGTIYFEAGSSTVWLPLDDGAKVERIETIEDNANEVTGYEGPTAVYFGTQRVEGSLAQSKLMPDFAIWSLAFALGTCTATTAGTSGYKHTITPLTTDIDHPSFSMIKAIGTDDSGACILKQKFSECLIDSCTITLGENYVSGEVGIVGGGYAEENFYYSTSTAAGNTTEVTASGTRSVPGSNAAQRLANVAELDAYGIDGNNYWQIVTPTAVSTAAPAVVSFTAIGTTTAAGTFRLFHYCENQHTFTFPSKITGETPLKLRDATITIGGSWNGTTFVGGETIACDLTGATISINNNTVIRNCAGSGVDYGTESYRGGRDISITLTERQRDFVNILKKRNLLTFGLRFNIAGDVIDVGGTDYFGVDFVFPSCALMDVREGADGGMHTEEKTIVPLVDATYGQVIVIGKNKQAAYIA
jgi:hypothetical protein